MRIELIGAPGAGKSTLAAGLREDSRMARWLRELPAKTVLDRKRIAVARRRLTALEGVVDEGLWQSGVSLGLSFGPETAWVYFSHLPEPDALVHCDATVPVMLSRNAARKRYWKGDLAAAAGFAAQGVKVAERRGIPTITIDTRNDTKASLRIVRDWLKSLDTP